MYKKPKNDDKYMWTNHVMGKMGYYRISESLVKRVVRFPKRVEKGIAPGTTACMQPAGSRKNPSEVWVMYQEIGSQGCSSKVPPAPLQRSLKAESLSTFLQTCPVARLRRFGVQGRTFNSHVKRKIITAWRYHGVSPIGEPIPIPEEILDEINGGA